MNKIILVLILVGSSKSFATTDFKSELKSKTNIGVISFSRLERTNQKLLVDGEEVRLNFLPLILDRISTLAQTEAGDIGVCSAGTYELKVTADSKTSIEKGCLESKRYSRLTESFDRLKIVASVPSKKK